MPGSAVRILTGAPLPDGADAVVPVEDTDATVRASLRCRPTWRSSASVAEGAHVRRAGSDLRAGLPLAPAGAELTPAALAVIAAGGHGSVTVHGRPRVAVLATGDELVAGGYGAGAGADPRQQLGRPRCRGARCRARIRWRWVSRTTISTTCVSALRRGVAWADVIVASGGVSVGAHDVVKDAFDRDRADRPVAGRRPAGQAAGLWSRARMREGREVLLFGLPGNPVSSLVTFELFVRPVLRRLAGHADVIGRELVRAATRAGGRARRPAGAPSCACGSTETPTMAGRRISPAARSRTCSRPSPRPTAWRSLPEDVRRRAGGHGGGGDQAAMRRATQTAPSAAALTHVSRGGRPRMVDVSDKPATARRAVAEAFVTLEQETHHRHHRRPDDQGRRADAWPRWPA